MGNKNNMTRRAELVEARYMPAFDRLRLRWKITDLME
jgi:hypothetical protein